MVDFAFPDRGVDLLLETRDDLGFQVCDLVVQQADLVLKGGSGFGGSRSAAVRGFFLIRAQTEQIIDVGQHVVPDAVVAEGILVREFPDQRRGFRVQTLHGDIRVRGEAFERVEFREHGGVPLEIGEEIDGGDREQNERDQGDHGNGEPRLFLLGELFLQDAFLLALVVHVLRLDLVVQAADGNGMDVRHEAAARRGNLAKLPDGVQQLLHVGEPLRRFLGHHLFDEGGDGRRQAGYEVFRRFRFLVEMLVRERADGDGTERERAGNHLVEGDAEAVDVAARVERLACELLRAHVGRAA